MEQKGARISVGTRTHFGGGSLLAAAQSIEVGDDVLIAFETLVMDHNSHSVTFQERRRDVQDWINGKKDWSRVGKRRSKSMQGTDL